MDGKRILENFFISTFFHFMPCPPHITYTTRMLITIRMGTYYKVCLKELLTLADSDKASETFLALFTVMNSSESPEIISLFLHGLFV